MHFSVVFAIFGISIFFETSNATPHPICIIGGGISGLTLSLLLQDKGYPVSLFEANSYFGGKIDTYKTSDGIMLEKGPIVLNPSQKYISKYIKMFNIATIPYHLMDFAFFNPISGNISFKYQLSQEQKEKRAEVSKRYRKAYEATYNIQEYSEIATNSDLTLPTLDFLKKHGIEDLRFPLSYFITLWGFGALEDTPSAYILHLFPPDEMDGILMELPIGGTARDGFSTFMERMAEKVKSKYLNFEAINLKRGDGKQEVEFLVNGSTTLVTRTCSRTILAFPPTLSNLLKLIPNLSQEEKKLFAKVKVHKYISSGHIIPSLHHTAYLGFIPKPVAGGGDGAYPEMEYPYGGGEVIGLAKSGKGSNPYAYQAYNWISGEYDNEPTEADLRSMERKMHIVLKRIHPSYSTQFIAGWFQYFPHVTGESIRSGFYKELENMQGQDGTYYASTLLTFESTNNAIEMAEMIVNKYFS